MTNRIHRLFSAVLVAAVAAGCSDDPTGTDTELTAPASVTAQASGATSVNVTYSAVTGASSYVIERAQGASPFGEAGTSASTTFSDTGLQASTTYRYRVHAVSGSKIGPTSAEVSVATTSTPVAGITADILTNRTLFADTVYKLTGFIHVANGATLTIQPGTVIQGDFNTLGSSLFILRGAKIIANGTAAKPIVFTSSQPAGSRRAGDWGGLIIVGNGVINRGAATEVEGTNTSASNYAVVYGGGSNNNDSSGELAYVRVEFAGYAPSTDTELNSFTFAAVGSGTKADHLQAMGGLDDAFEFFGGAMDAKHLVSYNTGDDHFDMSEGYQGRLQFLIAYQSRIPIPRTGAGGTAPDPQGIENDGCNGSGCTNGHGSQPYTIPLVANFTLIGTGPLAGIGAGGGVGVVLRRGTGGFYMNGVVARWPNAALSVRDAATAAHVASNELLVANVLTADNGSLYQSGQIALDSTANNVTKSAASTASLFTLFPTAASSAAEFDWTPAAASPIRTGGMTSFPTVVAAKAGAFVTPTSYLGAADPAGAKWWAGWTVYMDN